MTTRTAAVVLNYRTPDHAVNAVRSLKESSKPPHLIVVVDNASHDGSIQRLRPLNGCLLLETERNRGFSAGSNLGIRAAIAEGSERVFLMNADARVSPQALEQLGSQIERERDIGIAGPVLLSAGSPPTIESIGITWKPAVSRMRLAGSRQRLDALAPFERRDVDGVTGCAMLIERRAFEDVGGFADEYFFGFEDLDFCLRARAAGWRTICVGTALVSHEGQASIGRLSPDRIYFATRNHLLLNQRQTAGALPPVRALRTCAVVAWNLAHTLFTSPVPVSKGLRALGRGVRDFAAGRFGDQ
jgi:GT2 family glycosyltransferase